MHENYTMASISDAASLESESKANVFGTVVKKFISDNGDYCALTIDDETGDIRVKAFQDETAKTRDISEGDMIGVFGVVKEKNDERYVSPDIIVKIGLDEYVLKRLERAKKRSIDVLMRISGINGGKGASLDEIQKELQIPEEQAKEILFKLMQDGVIYEPKKGEYRVI